MTTFSRVLAVAVATCSVAFLGFVWVMLAGGPNWQAEMADLEGRGYSFTLGDEEIPTWSVKRSGESVSSSPIAPKTIVAVRKNWLQRQNEEQQALNERKDALAARIEELRPLITADQQAIENRRETLSASIDTLKGQLETLAGNVRTTADKGRETMEIVKSRWQEGYRVKEQVAEANADAARLDDEKQLLQARLVILEGNIDRLERIASALVARLPEPGDANTEDVNTDATPDVTDE